jgi:hypothetical protein
MQHMDDIYTHKAESGKIEHFKYLVNVPEGALNDHNEGRPYF